jgi:chromate transporter
MHDPQRCDAFAGTWLEVFLAFLKLGCTSFGGPIAHIGYFRNELAVRRQWLSESQFSQLVAICQFLPGPSSSQLGFSLGLARAGWPGALAAFVGFTLPSVILLLGFVAVLPWLSGDLGQAGLHGLKIVALAVVADAVLGMARKLCPDVQRAAIAIVVAGTLVFFAGAWLQILVVVAGAVAGAVLCRSVPAPADSQLSVSYGKFVGALLLLALRHWPMPFIGPVRWFLVAVMWCCRCSKTRW